MPRDKRQERDLHALDVDGMLLCNPRDKEAAHRAQTERIATDRQLEGRNMSQMPIIGL